MANRTKPLGGAVLFLAFACFAVPAVAEPDYSKFHISGHDIDAYKSTHVVPCREIQEQDPDFTKPPSNVPTLKHFVRLYAACQSGLEAIHSPVGVLRVNNVGFGATCVALALLDSKESLMNECNMKSYL